MHTVIRFFADGIPLICGGQICPPPDFDYDDCYITDKCFQYIPGLDTWEESGTMSGTKYGHAAAYTESWGLAMAEAGAPLEAYLPNILDKLTSILKMFKNLNLNIPTTG